MKNQRLADAFQAADAAATEARAVAAQAWILANAAAPGTAGDLIAEAERLDGIAADLDAKSEAAADAFLLAGGVLA